MKPKDNSWAVVVAGAWNRMIFTPEWVGKKVFQVDIVDALVPLMPGLPTRYQIPNMELAVQETKLVGRPRQYEITVLEQTEKSVLTILNLLPHTPIRGVGVNFAFVEEHPGPELLTHFNLKGDAAITNSWEISAKQIKRKLVTRDDDMILNLTVSYTSNATVEFNGHFHCDVTDAETAAAKIKDQTKLYYETFRRLLSDVYNVN